MPIKKLTFTLFSCLLAATSIAQEASSSLRLQVDETITDHRSEANRFTSREYQFDFEYQALLFEARHKTIAMPSVGSLITLAPGLQYYREIGDDWAVWPSLTFEFGFEHRITFDSITYSPQLVGLRSLSPDLLFIIGAGARYHSVAPQYYPVVGMAWQPEHQSLWSGMLAIPQSMVNFAINEQWDIQASLGWDLLYYSLHDDSSVGAYMRSQAFVPALELGYQVKPGVRVSSGLQFAFNRDFRFYNSQQQLTQQYSAENEWAVQLAVEITL